MVEWKKLGEVCEFLKGHSLSKNDLGKGESLVILYGELYTSYGNYITTIKSKTSFEKSKEATLLKYNDLVLPVSSTTKEALIGKVSVIKNNSTISLGSDSIILRGAFNPEYLMYYLNSSLFEKDKMSCVHGTTIMHLSPKELAQKSIPIPSISEQTRIVGILDTFTASIENLKQQIAQRRKQYEHYRDQLLDLEGKEGVEMKTLGDLCDTLSGFPFDSSQFKEEGIQLMRGANVKRGYFEFSQDLNKYWDSSEGLEKYLLEPNDIIISMDGSLVGRSFCYLKNEYLPMLLVQRVARLRVKGNFKYVYYNIAKSFPDYVDKKKTAGAIPHISMKDINGFAIPVPSLPEQQRIVSILDTFESSITNLEQQLAQRERQYEYYRNKLLTFE